MLIAIDLGNRLTKLSGGRVFVSGLMESDTRPPTGADTIYYNGKYYALSEKRIPYLRDKSADERFFILTLFAIAGEILAEGQPAAVHAISLAIGLPPSHYGSLHERFTQYFLDRGMVNFEYNGTAFKIEIHDVMCFPQAIAAAMTVFDQIRQSPKVMVIDIGGYTADYVRMHMGRADFSVCDSLEHGVIMLYNDIIRKVNADLDILLEEGDIDRLLRGDGGDYPTEVSDIVFNMAIAFINHLAGVLRERGIDLRYGNTVFVGGGAVLLKDYLEASEKFGNCVFVDDVTANAKGYALMYNAMRG